MPRRVTPLLFAAFAALLVAARGAPEGQPFAPGVVLDVTLDSFDSEARGKRATCSSSALNHATLPAPAASRR